MKDFDEEFGLVLAIRSNLISNRCDWPWGHSDAKPRVPSACWRATEKDLPQSSDPAQSFGDSLSCSLTGCCIIQENDCSFAVNIAVFILIAPWAVQAQPTQLLSPQLFAGVRTHRPPLCFDSPIDPFPVSIFALTHHERS